MSTTLLSSTKLRRHACVFTLAASALLCSSLFALAQDRQVDRIDSAALDQAVARAIAYFKQAQSDDGSFSASSTSGPGVTAIVASALLRNGRTVNDPVVARALKYLEGHLHEDGGIYLDGSRYKNYETSLSIVCFKDANKDGRYDKLLENAEKFVKEQQWDEGEGHEISSMNYGGAGYGSHSRPDLSNTSFLVEALHAVGRGEDDPALQKALVFISRCQNLESEHNTTEFASKVNDGGFYYTIAAGGQSQAGPTPEGGLRSYGSMTYAGLKSMIYAGVTRDDPRVQAAYEWIRQHYTLDENPGMGAQGLYYYYHTFAKALATLGDDQIVDANGQSHNWRADLAQHLIASQKPDGSWVNANPRWLEGDPNLATAYALLALSYCRP
jgi:squalene-hopene/tetraprenyl-beta-curcumene cyclase